MLRKSSKHMLAVMLCLLLLCAILLLAGCGNDYKNPGPGTPQTTPTNGGYSIIYVIGHEMHFLLAAHGTPIMQAVFV